MATTLFDLQVSSSAPSVGDGLNEKERSSIFRKPSISSTKPKEAGSLFRAEIPEVQIDENLSLDDIEEAYDELIARTKDVLRVVAARGEGLVLEFNPMEKPALADAVSSIFQGVNNKITMQMFLAALQLEKDISIEVGESQLGAIR